MLDSKRIRSLPEMAAPALTAYLNTNPGNGRNQGSPPGYVIWLKSRAQLIGERISREERKELQAQLKRIERYLRTARPSCRGLAVFAGPATWEEIPLQVEVEDELHWGRPSLTQLLWLMDEHQPSGAVVVDRSEARFFRLWLGEIEEQEKEKFVIDMTQWRDKSMMLPSHPGVYKTRGSQRDVFQQRLEAQFDRFYRDTADRIWRWSEREKLMPTLIGGPGEAVERVWKKLPAPCRTRITTLKNDLSDLKLSVMQERMEPEIAQWKRAHELERISELLNLRGGRRAAVGIDETLQRLQEGKVRELLVARGLGGRLRQCAQCGWTSRSADRTCASCGGERRTIPLRAVLPELARQFAVRVEVVAGAASRRLREEGDGIGAWLR